MKLKKLLASILCFAMVLSTMGTAVFAQSTAVAKVGNTEYATIDEAIAAWTNNTTLTLLADVTLSDVIKLSSTEYHILDLSTYTMTAAKNKDAIQYVVNGRSTAGYALDIKADATNPGGITATGKTIVSHIKPSSGAPSKDRPITRFYGGVFNASYVVRQGGTFGAGYTGASAPYFQFYGGTYNGTIYTNRSQNQFHGGTFNGSMQMSVDSSAYTMVAGGTFKNLSNSMGSALNSDKFTIGSSKGANNGSVCIDENGNYVITTTTPTEAEASVASNYNSSNYFYYSTVNTNGMYYEDVYDALEGNKTGTVTVFTDELNLTDSSFKGTIVVPEGGEISIVVAEGVTPAWTVESAVENEEPNVTYADEEGNALVKGDDGKFEILAPAKTFVAQIGDEKFETVLGALTAAMESTTATEIKLLQDSTELLTDDFWFIVNSDVVITSETPVTAAFYNNGTNYDLVFGSENNNTVTIGDNVTLKINDRNIWLGYYGDRNVTVKVYGTLSAGYQLWSGSDVEVYGTIESLGEALVLRRGKTLTVDGGKVNANYFSILAGNIDAKNGADIKCGPVWIGNTGGYAGEGNVEIALDNATLTSSGNLKSATEHADGVSITITNGSTASFTGSEHGPSQLDASTNLVVSDDSTLNMKSLTNNGTIEVADGGKVSATGTVTNNGAIKVENEDDFEGTVSGNQPVIPSTVVATVNGEEFADLQEAIVAAAPSGTVEIVNDVTVDEWIMISQKLSISSGQIINIPEINGLTINGGGNCLTVNSIESASNGNCLFFDATNLNINNLTINYGTGVAGSIGLTSGTISNVTFNGGSNAIFPGEGDITITGCTFNTTGVAIYNEAERDKLVVTGNTFNTAADQYAIYLRGNTTFTNNTVITGKVNVTNSATGEISGNDFGDERFKVYNAATATITNNKINNLVFDNDSEVKSTFEDNTLSEEAQAALDAVTPVPVATVNGTGYTTLQEALNAAVAGEGNVTVEILEDIDLTNVDWNPVTVSAPKYPVVTVNGNSKTITGLNDMLFAGTWAGGSGLIINDLTIAASTIVNDKDDAKGTVGVGAFIGFPQASATVTLNNCHLVDSHVEGGHWTGGLIGYAAGYAGTDGPVFMNLTIKDCSVTGSTITGKGSTGGIIGHATGNAWTQVTITDTAVSGNTVTSTGSSTNKAGAVIGTIGAAGQATTVNGVEKTGGVSVAATVSSNTVTSAGATITTIYGRQGTPTGMLYVAGGKYDNYPIEENVAYAAPVEGYEIVEKGDGTFGIQVAPSYVAEINGTGYKTLEEALAAAKAGDEIVLLANVEGNIDVPANVTFNGNGFAVNGTFNALGDITFAGHTKMTAFDFAYTGTTFNIGAGACLEITGTGRMVIGHGCTFNITGSVVDAKTADIASITPSLIAPGASFTGAGVNFNVTNAYVKFTAYCSSKNNNANNTFNFDITNSIWDQTGSLVFSEPTSGKDPTFNFNLKDSVLNSTSHLVFAVTKGDIVIDNSDVNKDAARQLEIRSNMIIKNGSVVYASDATSSNAKKPGTLTVDNATYVGTGDYSGSDVGTGTLIVKQGAKVSTGKITNANIVVDATNMVAGDVVDITADLSKLAGTVSVINNNLDAKIEDGKIVLVVAPAAKIGEQGYATLAEAIAAAKDGDTVELLADVTLDNTLTIEKSITIDGKGHKLLPANAENTYNSAIMAGNSGWGDANNTVSIKLANLDISGWKAIYGVVRVQGVTFEMDGCELSNNTVSNSSYSVVSLNYANSVVENCVFNNNTVPHVLDANFNGDDSTAVITLNNCEFNSNVCSGAAVVYKADGEKIIVKDSKFIGNTVSTSGNAATLYTGWGDSDEVTGCLFKDNDVITSHTTTKRFASAIFCDGCVVNENAFDNNTATRNGEAIATTVAVGAYYGAANVSGNYFDGSAPTLGVNYTVEYERNEVTLDSYYTEYSVDENGNVALDTKNLVNIPTVTYVAEVNGTGYKTLEEAVAVAEAGDTITLISDITIDAPLTIAKGKEVTLDLNGKTVVYNSTVMGEAMITNKGTLTIDDTVGTGVINYNYTGEADPTYGKGNYTISNAGTLTVNGGKITIANLSRHAKYPIDNNSTTGDAILVINGGHLYNYNTSAIRQFCNSTTNANSVTINGGLIEGYSAIWVQNPGKNTVNGSLSITGGEVKTTAAAYVNGTAELKDVSSGIYCTIAGEGGAWDGESAISITGGTINENVKLSTNAPADITVEGEATFNGRVEVPVAEEPEENIDTKIGFITTKLEDGNYKVSILAGIDSLNYRQVGFEFTCGDDIDAELSTNKVYTDFTAAGEPYSPDKFGAECEYIFAVTGKLPAEGDQIIARAFAEKLDGTFIYSGYYASKTLD